MIAFQQKATSVKDFLLSIDTQKVKTNVIGLLQGALHFQAYGEWKQPKPKQTAPETHKVKLTKDNVLLLAKASKQLDKMLTKVLDAEVSEARRKILQQQATSFLASLTTFQQELTKPFQGIEYYLAYEGDLDSTSSIALLRVEKATGKTLHAVWFD